MSNPKPWFDPVEVEIAYETSGNLARAQIDYIKSVGGQFMAVLDRLGEGREVSIAKTHVDAAILWATKHVTDQRKEVA